jgi:hypothetical protein
MIDGEFLELTRLNQCYREMQRASHAGISSHNTP